MNNSSTKIVLILLTAVLISACNAVKKVPTNRSLLIKNKVEVDGKLIKDEAVTSQIVQQPNSAILGFKLRMHMYNLAKNNTDSIFRAKYTKNPEKYYRKAKWLSKKQVNRLGKSFWYSGWHKFLTKTGEAPVIIDTIKATRSTKRLRAHYFDEGYFDAVAKYKINYLDNKRGTIDYTVTKGKPTFLDTISRKIQSKAIDSLYLTVKNQSKIKFGQQYKTENFDAERSRLTTLFRNKGIYNFQQQNILFEIDTTTKKAPVIVTINNREYKAGDSIKSRPFHIYKIGEVDILTYDLSTKNKKQFIDSAQYKNFNIYSTKKLRYRSKALTDAVFIQKDSLYSDDNRTLTLRSLSNLRVFNYPNIEYIEDTITKKLNVKIHLTAKDKYSFRANADFTHSNIMDFGIAGSTSFSIRNIFRGAEILELALRGNIGASKDLANPDNRFFNLSEVGADLRLTFPRIFAPFNTDKIIPKRMFPNSLISLGFSKQTNIGLDKENLTSTVSYNWIPKKNTDIKFDLVNLQYVKNVNIDNYFNVYNSSYNRLNDLAQAYNTEPEYMENGNLRIPDGANDFIIDALTSPYFPGLEPTTSEFRNIQSIKERKDRLTENNLIFASNFSFSKNNKSDFADKQFYSFRGKIETAGNFLTLVSRLANQPENENGTRNIFGLTYSQYIKTDFEFIRHWDLKHDKSFAFRSFFGIAIPYGNSKSIPFSRSYFAGGTNDNRAWQSYSLGPGSSGGLNDFNEANMKIALNAEFRFKFFGDLNGALFADCGNIWNISDSETDPTKVFSGFKSLKNLALGTGTGFRYDFKFFIVRFDYGFKTYNPALMSGEKWFKEMRFDKGVLNIGINYPF
ncbi:translocation and assembly module lipoprotein TamL [Flavobacterium sp. GCM10027622]|uniref:translocation and assembly module lipoprotein TamL n=1 Tax=unclassified Flavobacterium TaxID=196869 RepID=UPI003613A569